jgi:predicted CXXCH cytochrome family protein
MKPALIILIAIILLILAAGVAAAADADVSAQSIINSPHNLSASGPGKVKSTGEQQVCIFCHTPHHASAVQPLWNRNLPVNAYRVYSSSTLISTPGQPTGSSKLCLSCHDGTIALGSLLTANQTLNFANGVTTIPSGPMNLGTDLSGSHPISFTYDANLATKNGKLADPASLPKSVVLENGQLQCTSCHDPHDDSRGNFLVMTNRKSQLCNSCHTQNGQSTITAHNQCADCHQQHNAPSGAYLLSGATVTATCTTCHGNGAPTLGANVMPDLNKISRHAEDASPSLARLTTTVSPHSANVSNSVNCADCHEPHSMTTGSTAAPSVLPVLGKVSGMSASGAAITRSKFEYEVCFKCHGENTDRPFVTRNAIQTNVRLQFQLSAVSFHPIEAPGRGHDVPSLTPNYTIGSIIRCTDCHGSDSGSSGAKGPHGSNIAPLLLANYETTDGTSESSTAYALCYNCHERSSILGNVSFSRHSIYIVDQRTPCSVCHDSHGISSAQGTMRTNSHLMNFDTTVVRPDPITKRLEYVSTGPRTGKCYLLCHGKDHSGLHYP